ncbi:MAG: AraC family ligand binding domain-containing protein, partial [Mogibacterium sp.]|nr:AraC family ligand binding domain-containing protein [Mogibacterium sp.]
MHKTISQAAELLWTNDFFISPDDSIKPHRHPYFYHMFFLSKGNRTISLSGNDYNINEGQAVLASPDTEHGICCSDSSEDSQFIEIKFIVYSNTLNAALKDLPPVWNLDITAQNMMKEIIAMSQKTSGYSKTNIIRYFLGTLLYYICKDVLEKKNEPSLP